MSLARAHSLGAIAPSLRHLEKAYPTVHYQPLPFANQACKSAMCFALGTGGGGEYVVFFWYMAEVWGEDGRGGLETWVRYHWCS